MKYQPFFKSLEGSDVTTKITSRERFLAAVVEHTPECVKLVDANGILLDMNPVGLELIEADDWESVQGANVYDLMAPEHVEKFREFNAYICDGNKGSLEFEIIALKGSRRWMLTTAVPFQLPHNNVVQLAITRDITAEKERQLELEKSKKKAEAANVAKNDFLANMSHEIRTPMTAIMGHADVLIEGNSDLETLQSAETIKRNGSYLLDIVEDILDISKIESGKLQVEKVKFSTNSILNEIFGLHQMRANEKKLDFKVSSEGPIPTTLQSDPLRLRQILNNLVGNAIKFTEKGSVSMTARLIDNHVNEPHLEFEVSDTGIGMREVDLKNIFKNFTQVDNSSTRNYGGIGLGLSISKRLARMLNGDIQVKSMPGQGSSFILKIELNGIDGCQLFEFDAGSNLDSHQKQSKQSKMHVELDCRVLLVEDGFDNQNLISYVLDKAGIEVEIAGDGQAAFDLAMAEQNAGTPFDIILMDMQMPILDGYCATKKLRSENYTHPIIALTAHAMKKDRDKCLEAGCDDYLQKPIDFIALLDAIHRWSRLRSSVETLPL